MVNPDSESVTLLGFDITIVELRNEFRKGRILGRGFREMSLGLLNKGWQVYKVITLACLLLPR